MMSIKGCDEPYRKAEFEVRHKMESAIKNSDSTSTHFLPPHFETPQARWVSMFQDRLQELEIICSRLEATNARLEATNASLRQDIDLSCTGRIVLNEPHVYTKHHACFFRVPVFTGVRDNTMHTLQDFANALGRYLRSDEGNVIEACGFELSMSPFADVWPGHRTKRPISYIDGLVEAWEFTKGMHISLADSIQSAWIGTVVKPTPLHELCVDTYRSHDVVVDGFVERTPHFLVLQPFLKQADNYGCFRTDGTVINSPCTVPPRWTPHGYDYHDECDVYCRAPGCLEFGPTEWTNAFLDALATNKIRMSNRQSRRKIKEVLDKLGHIPRAQTIDYSVD